MMSTQEYKLVNAYDKLDVKNVQIYQEQLSKLKTEVKPKDYQGISMNGYIIFEGNYHADAIITYKVPRKKVDYEIYKFDKEIQEEVGEQQIENNLTKKQIKDLYKQIKELDCKIDKQIAFLRNAVKRIKEEEKKKKQIDNFTKLYEKFFDCLSSELASFDLETKTEIKIKLVKLVQLIEDTIKNHLE